MATLWQAGRKVPQFLPNKYTMAFGIILSSRWLAKTMETFLGEWLAQLSESYIPSPNNWLSCLGEQGVALNVCKFVLTYLVSKSHSLSENPFGTGFLITRMVRS